MEDKAGGDGRSTRAHQDLPQTPADMIKTELPHGYPEPLGWGTEEPGCAPSPGDPTAPVRNAALCGEAQSAKGERVTWESLVVSRRPDGTGYNVSPELGQAHADILPWEAEGEVRTSGAGLLGDAEGLFKMDLLSAGAEAGNLLLEQVSSLTPLAAIKADATIPLLDYAQEPPGAGSGSPGHPVPPGPPTQNPCVVHSTSSSFSLYAGLFSQRVCVICGDEASGCHYGVLTCGSCKVFFKRAVEGRHNYLCAGRNDCIVDKIRRKNCPACRLRKCYQAGMVLGGRRLKKFGTLKAMAQPLALSPDSQALTLLPLACYPGTPLELQFSPRIINVLESIEPDVVYSGYDNSQPELPHLLLNSLNRLCERQLRWIVKWSKSLPGFRNLHITDQMSLIEYSWMSLMLFSLGWRSFQDASHENLYFAPDLILNQERMRRSPIWDLCLTMQLIPREFANLQVTKEEFLCMKVLILLNTVPLDGLKSQEQFEAMRQHYIRELSHAIQLRESGMVACSQRFYHLTKLMDAMHTIVKKVNLYCLSTFIQAETLHVEFPEMMTEVIASQLPNILAGMVRPLLFHRK